MIPTGLYEQIISKALENELANSDKLSQVARIDEAEAAKILAKYVAEIVERGLENVKDNGGSLDAQVGLVNHIVSTIVRETNEAEFDGMSVAERAEQLLALFERRLPEGSSVSIISGSSSSSPRSIISISSFFSEA